MIALSCFNLTRTQLVELGFLLFCPIIPIRYFIAKPHIEIVDAK